MEVRAMTSPINRPPQIFGTGLVALDLVISANPDVPVRSWAGGTCGNVLSILSYLGWDAYPIARLNSDPAAKLIRADMKRWGVHLDFVGCGPTTDTPIIIQHILRARDGSPKHRFSWSCPHCGSWLPGFKPVTTKVVDVVAASMQDAKVFFMDRLSRAALLLAQQAAENGAVVVFEPSAKSDEKLLREAVGIAHVIKYSDQRFEKVLGAMERGSATLVEIQTLGATGLRFRHRLGRGVSAWKQLAAIPAPLLADTCGSGDWCTAGLIAKIAGEGREGLVRTGSSGLVAALQYGQTLAAWNCGFEGARGGMYVVDRQLLDAHIKALSSGRFESVPTPVGGKRRPVASVACPACPQESNRGRGQSVSSRQDKVRHPTLV